MLARQVVLPTPPISVYPKALPSPHQPAPACPEVRRVHSEKRKVSPLAATLMDLPACVANKRLTASLNPLDAALTKNRGVGAPPCRVSTLRLFNSSTLRPFYAEPFRCPLLSLFAPRVFHNSFAIKRFRTLSQKCRVSPPPHPLFLKYYFNPSANSSLDVLPTFELANLPKFQRLSPPAAVVPLPFPIRCILFVPNRAGTESRIAGLNSPFSDHWSPISFYGSLFMDHGSPLPWQPTTTAPIPPSRHHPASWRGLSSAPTTKPSA
jgi:hypothetical protein